MITRHSTSPVANDRAPGASRRSWRITLVALLGLLGLVAAACGSDSATTGSGAASSDCPTDFTPIKAGTPSVVTSLPGPGFWDGSDDDPTKITGGYEYDIVQAIKESCASTRGGAQPGGPVARPVAGPDPALRHHPPGRAADGAALLNDFIGLQKDTALASVVGTVEVFNTAGIYKNRFFNLTPVAVAGPLFLVKTIPLARFTDWLIRRDQHRMQWADHDAPAEYNPPTDDAGQQAPHVEFAGGHKHCGPNHVLRGIDLDIGHHEVVCYIGASGCDKSTLLRCVNALEEIQQGQIRVAGEAASGPGVDVDSLRRVVGIVFQGFNLFPHMTVLRTHEMGVARDQDPQDDRLRGFLRRVTEARRM